MNEARRLATLAGIDVEFVLREEWELAFLGEIAAESDPEWIFRGGTALRLAYGSPRYSVDLDFSTTASLSPERFAKIIRRWERKHPEVKAKDLWSKRLTHLADFRIQVTGYSRAIGLKVEVSRRSPYPPRSSYGPRLVKSENSALQAIVQVSSLERLDEEKRKALRGRRRPLDLYDLWFISEQLFSKTPLPRHDFTRNELAQELRKYLPKRMHNVIDLLAEDPGHG